MPRLQKENTTTVQDPSTSSSDVGTAAPDPPQAPKAHAACPPGQTQQSWACRVAGPAARMPATRTHGTAAVRFHLTGTPAPCPLLQLVVGALSRVKP